MIVPIPGQTAHITPSEARADVRVTFPDGLVFSAPPHTPVGDYVDAAYPTPGAHGPILAAIVDGALRELTLPLSRDAWVKPVTLADSDGGRIYRRSLVFVMTTAAAELFPGLQIAVEHSLPEGGFYCKVVNRPNFDAAALDALRERMRHIVAADAPITRHTMPLAEAVVLFAKRGDDDKVRLLDYRQKTYLTLYALRDNIDYFYGYMVRSTGVLTVFDLAPAEDGFILRYPRPEQPAELMPLIETGQMERIFRETRDWLRVIGIEDVGRLNEAVAERRIREVILVAEALHTQRIADIAQQIATRQRTGMRLVLIAGTVLGGQDDVQQAAGRPVDGARNPAVHAGNGQLFRRPRTDPAGRSGRV